MLNSSARLAMATSVLKALPGKLDIKRHSPSIPHILPIHNVNDKDSCVAPYIILNHLADVDECLNDPCLHNGICGNTQGSYMCSCVPQWTGINCQTGKLNYFLDNMFRIIDRIDM